MINGLLIVCSIFFQVSVIAQNNEIGVKINPEISFQTIHNFGASDAWSCQFVGQWPDSLKNHVADLLFSLETNEDGTPKGIGLSCWRFNIGAGSAEQKGETKIGDSWRRTECFLQSNGSYDWKKQKGERWFLQAAKARGVEQFIGFSNSPPVWMTKNGRANSDGGNSMNIAEEKLPDFSRFLVEVTKNIQRKDGILFDYISPVNEPQWDWKDGQEGSPWTNSEIAELCHILGNDLKSEGLKTQISIAEAGLLTHLFDRGNDLQRGFQIKDFFSSESGNYIGEIPSMANHVAAHSYFTVKNDLVLKDARKKVLEEVRKVNPSVEYWMSEFCILGGNGILKGGGRDLGMETALFVANVIHADLTIANASAWQWWLAVSPYDFKDGLVYIDKSETGGNVYESKLLWALGNFSRFIRPGAKRIFTENTENDDLKIAAFVNTDGRIVVVIMNRGNKPEQISFQIQGVNVLSADVYETSAENSLSKVKSGSPDKRVEIPAQSISTVVFARQ